MGVASNTLLHFSSSASTLKHLQDDPWGPAAGPCFTPWSCCGSKYNATTCNATCAEMCKPACAADADTASVMGGIHPRSKKPVGDRLGTAAYNTVYGGKNAFTGPTLSGCSASGSTLTINFNTTLLRGDKLRLNPIFPLVDRLALFLSSFLGSAGRRGRGGGETHPGKITQVALLTFSCLGDLAPAGLANRGWQLFVCADQRFAILHGGAAAAQFQRSACQK